MFWNWMKVYRLGLVFFAGIVMNACILREYDVEGVDLEENWEFEITTPLFKGELSLENIIAGMDTFTTFPGNPVTEVQFSDDSTLVIATELLYEPVHFLEDFHFYINDDYEIKEGSFTYTVTNSLPFPVNLQTKFFFITEGPDYGDINFIPPSFAPARHENNTVTPVTTIRKVTIPVESLDFFRRNRVRFTMWFGEPADSLYAGPLLASHPLDITIVFSGVVNEKKKHLP